MRNTITSKKLEAQLKAYQALPYAVGQTVLIPKKLVGHGGQTQNVEEIVGYKIVAVDGDNLVIESNSYGGKKQSSVSAAIVIEKDDFHVGFNPFKPRRMPRVTYYNVDLWQLLHRCGIEDDGTIGGRNGNYVHKGVVIEELNTDPYVFDKHGVKHYFQRALVWKLKQKQKLIHSIYEELSIGTFMFRKRGYSEATALIDKGETKVAFNDLVDGKQRVNTIVEFISGKFPDQNGNYFGDFSAKAKRVFLGYDRLSFGVIEEGTPDSSVIFAFLDINVSGTPVSKSHISKIQQIEF